MIAAGLPVPGIAAGPLTPRERERGGPPRRDVGRTQALFDRSARRQGSARIAP